MGLPDAVRDILDLAQDFFGAVIVLAAAVMAFIPSQPWERTARWGLLLGLCMAVLSWLLRICAATEPAATPNKHKTARYEKAILGRGRTTSTRRTKPAWKPGSSGRNPFGRTDPSPWKRLPEWYRSSRTMRETGSTRSPSVPDRRSCLQGRRVCRGRFHSRWRSPSSTAACSSSWSTSRSPAPASPS